MSYAKRFIGVERLPTRLSEFDVRQAFCLSKDDIAAISERFRHDRRVAAAIQMLFLRASGRPMDRFASVPKMLLRSVCEALATPAVSIASLRSLYERRQTLYEHQAWARAYLGLQDLDDAQVEQLEQVLTIAALEAAHPDDLAETARLWLYDRRIVIPGPRRLADWARRAFDTTEAAMAATIEAAIGKAALRRAIDWAYSPQAGGLMGSHLEWLKTPPKRHAPSTMVETLEKVRALKELGAHNWALDPIALSKQQAYAAHVQMRRPSMTARIEQQRQTVEIACFLRVTLLELTDAALMQASRRSQDLFRRAAERVQTGRSRSSGATLQQAIKAKSVLHDETKTWRDRVLEARAMLDDIGDVSMATFASQVRRALAEDSRRVHAHLAGLRDIDFAGTPGDTGYEQWQAWSMLQALNTKEVPPDFELPPVGAAWSAIVSDLDPQSRYRAFEASTMMALRKSLRRGSAWVNHSITFRARESMLLADKDWTSTREQHHQILGLPVQAMAFLEPILAGMSVGLSALAEAADQGHVEIGADKLLHLPPIRPLDEEVEPRKTREAVFKHIGQVQLPDLLMEVDAATHFSEALLARRPSSSNELLAAYGALLAHGTDIDAKGVGSMIPGIDAAHIATAMRAIEFSGRLRRANERVSEYQNAVPIAALWGDGSKGSADMMALDASRHLWTARVDPRRRTYAAGMYTHVRDRWGLFYDQPIVLNERQAGVAVEGVEQHNRAEDRIRISLLAVDTHGVTNVAMAIAKLLGFDLCPRLQDLRERKLFVPRGWPVPESLEVVTVRRISVKAIERGWDDLVRLVASIRAGKVSAAHAIHGLGSAAVGDPLHRAAEHLGRLLRTLFLCDYLAIPDYRREIHTLLNRGESVHQLQRAIHGGHVAHDRGRRRQEMVAISGAHALLTNIVLAWNTNRMDGVVARLKGDGVGIEEDWLRRIGPAHFSHINFRGTFRFNLERYADVLVERAAGRVAAQPDR
ncbi:Transposase, TnpA family [Methylibium sp. T29-B]|uniref:Tn3 family transposase n=1 Tax=unclassified Methylibium TaxID=2633235 RepID=UPI0003F40B8F|nr:MULTISPECIES: Tn3 family transposase [unclassified Methylibium]AIA99047.1 Transposase, TnpA family [Methylibium sp. T29]EWS60879.1 Transposase, TnpA family [Methylibium sp. T29-B]MBI5270815.1 Tn3 family transposase [Burkholderiales bacterium]